MKRFHHLACLFTASSLLAAAPAFPPHGSEQSVRGELVSADFIHRSGQFRAENGELISFAMPPYAVMKYRGVEADLRDVPIGTKMTFLMLPAEDGCLTRLLTTQDDLSADEAQRSKFTEFTKARGLPGWVEKTEDKKMIVTLFSGDAKSFKKTWMADFSVGKEVRVCVANDELRTWNPPVDGERGSVVEVQKAPADCYGCSGVRLVITVGNMLEGFRQGRVVRVFGPGWPVKDQLYGESLMGYGFGRMLDEELKENPAKEYPEQFPFRTDYGNDKLPWYQLKSGVKPPPFSAHVVHGELIRADQFRTERSAEVVNFTLIPAGSVKYLHADAALADIPLGTRCYFHLYQDDQGAFTKASLVSDDFSHLAANYVTFRIDALRLDEGKIHIAWQIPEVKDYNGDMQRPPDIGRSELRVSAATRVWRDKRQVKLADLMPGDELRVNFSGELPGKPAHCLEIWIGPFGDAATKAGR